MLHHLMQTHNRYLTGLLFVSLLSISSSLMLLLSSPFGQIFYLATYIILIAVCILYSEDSWSQHLMRFQIYLIVPSVISFALTTHYFLSSYILHYLLFILINLICMTELVKRKKSIIVNNELKRYMLGGTVIFVALSAASFFAKEAAIIIFIMGGLFLFLLTIDLILEPKKKQMMQYRYNRMTKFYAGILIAMTLLQTFVPAYGIVEFLFAIIYVVLATELCFRFRDKQIAFGLLCVLLLLNHFWPGKAPAAFDLTLIGLLALLLHIQNSILYEIDSSYGFLRVLYDYKTNKIMITNDGVIHGEHYYYGNTKQTPNFWYYGNTLNNGPIYQIFADCDPKTTHKNIAVLGLGIGTVSAYGKPGQNWTFYELNAEMKSIATNSEYFSFLATSKANLSYVIGDARTNLAKAEDGKYGVIFVDVYSGSKIPKPFLTIEAIQIYLAKLNQNGLIIIHTTTTDRGVGSIIAKIAKTLDLSVYVTYIDESSIGREREFSTSGLFVYKNPTNNKYRQFYREVLSNVFDIEPESRGGCVSRWIVLARRDEDLLHLPVNKIWHRLSDNAAGDLLTDAAIGYGDEARGVITNQIT